MRVISWNVWWRFGDRWRERERAIAATLAALRPDIVGLQESWGTADGTQPELLAAELGMHCAYGAPSLPPPPDSADHAGVEVGVGLLSRWPIATVEQQLLPSRHRPEIVALEAVVDHPSGALRAVVTCIDWEREFAAQRLSQTRALAALMTDPSRAGPLPALLTADLNAPPDAPEIRALTDVMVDAWTAAGDPTETGHTLSSANPLTSGDSWQIDQRIDYVLARAGSAKRPVVVERAFLAAVGGEGLQPPSDHYAVVADFRL